MTSNSSLFLKSYGFSFLLIASSLLGALLGQFFPKQAILLKPFGDIFLNLLFCAVVPLVFFSMASAVAGMSNLRRLGKLMSVMLLIFVLTAVIASLLMIGGIKYFNPTKGMTVSLQSPKVDSTIHLGEQLTYAVSASDFYQLLSKKNMLALIVFSVLIGLSTAKGKDKAQSFYQFLLSGNEVMLKVIGYIMWLAPVGLASYFAYLVATLGAELWGSYSKAILLYYPLAIVYFVVGFSFYAWLAGGLRGIKIFWQHIWPTALTAWGTGSSVATIPTNLATAQKIGIPEDIRELVIPLGATIHMDGSCLAAILKMALVLSVFQIEFNSGMMIFKMVGVAILSGTVISGIPSGGMLGEMLILNFFGLPLEAMPIMTMIGTLVDPPATMVNATGDTVSAMMVARVVNGKDWMPLEDTLHHEV